MDRQRFVIEPSEAESMANQLNLTVLELLPALVKSAKPLARPPISKYHVGAVGLGSSGRIFLGVNLEFPGLPLHHSVHAEQFLVTNLSLNGERSLEYFAVSSAPCGHCRQFLQEIRNAPDLKLLITSSSETNKFTRFSKFLPDRFGPDDLLDRSAPLLLEPNNNGLTFPNHLRNGVVNGFVSSNWDDLKREALEAANKSHAPYSACPSGVALMDLEGKIYKGSYMESAAYNPSMGPVQAALVAYVVGGGGGYESIISAAVVEREEAAVKQEHTARLLIQQISPKCEFRVFQCNSKSNGC